MGTEMSQPHQDPPTVIFRVVTESPVTGYRWFRYYWDLEKGAKRYGLSSYPNSKHVQWIERAEISEFVRIDESSM